MSNNAHLGMIRLQKVIHEQKGDFLKKKKTGQLFYISDAFLGIGLAQ